MNATVKSKAWYTSKGVWGSLIGAAASGAGYAVQYTGTVSDELSILIILAGLLGAILSGIGRLDAYRPIHIFKQYSVIVRSDE